MITILKEEKIYLQNELEELQLAKENRYMSSSSHMEELSHLTLTQKEEEPLDLNYLEQLEMENLRLQEEIQQNEELINSRLVSN